MKKRLSFLMALVLMVMSMGSFVSAESFADHYDYTNAAEYLHAKGILKGTDKGLELESELTRVQGMIIYFRLLGHVLAFDESDLENLLLDVDTECPFTDVPEWAWGQITYLHYLGHVKGVSETKLGSNSNMTVEQFMTLILRVLGYDDSEGDFVWDKSLDKALEIDLLADDSYDYFKNKDRFTRGDMSYLVSLALDTNLKDQDMTLMELRYRNENPDLELEEPFEGITISDEDKALIPEQFREKIFEHLIETYSDYRTREMIMTEVKYNENDEGANLKFNLKRIYNDKGVLREYTMIMDVNLKTINGNLEIFSEIEDFVD